MTVAFCTYCSALKSKAAGSIPAIQRYQSSRIERTYEAANLLGIEFYILSGEYGLLRPSEPIPWYDHLLVPDEVSSLVPIIVSQMKDFQIHHLLFMTRSMVQFPELVPYHDTIRAASEQARIALSIVEIGNV